MDQWDALMETTVLLAATSSNPIEDHCKSLKKQGGSKRWPFSPLLTIPTGRHLSQILFHVVPLTKITTPILKL